MTDTIPPSRVWDFFHAYKKDLTENMRLIASSSDGMLGIYLTEKGGDPFFVVEDCDDPIDEEIATSKKDCEETVKKLYAKYLDDDDNFFESEAIDEREDELSVLFENLIMDIVDKGCNEDGLCDIIEDVKEHTLEYIARKHGLRIYRPMFLVDEYGDFYSEYPYEEMEFEDDNPIYDP